MSNVSLMRFIQSKNEPLGNVALPLLKQNDSEIILNGALLFSQGKNTGEKLVKEQVQMATLLQGNDKGRQRLTGHMSESRRNRRWK